MLDHFCRVVTWGKDVNARKWTRVKFDKILKVANIL